jgi:predicted nucleotidyltransferase
MILIRQTSFNQERKNLALEVAQTCTNILIKKFGAKKVILFGSLAGQTPWHDRSDIDLAVEGLPEGTFFRAYSVCRDLLPQGIELDLVPLEDAYPEMRARILQGTIMNQNSLKALKLLIDDELISLERIVNDVQAALQEVGETPSQLEVNGLAAYLHQYYTGIEAIFRRISLQIDRSFPTGERSHLDLLEQMAENIPQVRTALINPQQYLIFKDYLNFRHFFRHAYGYKLRWQEIRLKLVMMPESFEQLSQRLDEVFQELMVKETEP